MSDFLNTLAIPPLIIWLLLTVESFFLCFDSIIRSILNPKFRKEGLKMSATCLLGPWLIRKKVKKHLTECDYTETVEKGRRFNGARLH